jgi:hypothetical protein
MSEIFLVLVVWHCVPVPRFQLSGILATGNLILVLHQW